MEKSLEIHTWFGLAYDDFPDHDDFVSFIDRFLGFNSDSHLQKFVLRDSKYNWKCDDPDVSCITPWIRTVLERKVRHLHVLEDSWHLENEVDMPITVYTCESLVSLKLHNVSLPNPESVSLPSLKVLSLKTSKFANNRAFEMLIKGCPGLERLKIVRSPYDNVNFFRVCSHSLLRFTHNGHGLDFFEEELVVVSIDAPRLETLKLTDTETDTFLVNNLVSLVKVDIDIEFNLSYVKNFDPNDLAKRNMIRNFFIGISSVEDMTISSETLEAVYNHSGCEQVPLLPKLSSLHADFRDNQWELLPNLLGSCPSLKSLYVGFSERQWKQPVSILHGPHRFLPSLEYVEIEKPIGDDVAEMKLVSYFLENSKILKKLTLRLSYLEKDESVFVKKLLTIPRLSSSCQVLIT